MIRHFTVVCKKCWKVIRVSKTYLNHKDVVRPTLYSLCGMHRKRKKKVRS